MRNWYIDPKTITPGCELGRGSFGVVRAAVWRHTPVAIKILYLDAQAEDQDLFEREVATMSTLHHPNIVQFLGYTRTPALTLVIEYFAEGSLEDYVREHKISVKQALTFCVQAALAIEYLHSRRPSIVIHRDIKPANFLLTASHRVKLGDFGIARTRRLPAQGDDDQAAPPQLQPNAPPVLPSTPSLMRMPSTEDLTSNCGTVRFMAPEVASPGQRTKTKYDTSADIFSLSMVYYFVWERVLPSIPDNTTPIKHLMALRSGLRPTFHKTPKGKVRTIIDEMWMLDPLDRLTASQVIDALKDVDEKTTKFANSFF